MNNINTPSVAPEVVIIGAGVAGLTLATFLTRAGVHCVVLERRDRAYIEQRNRAGVVEARGVDVFERWGLADDLLGGPLAGAIDYRVNGAGRVFDTTLDGRGPSRFCTQQMLVNNLLHQLLDVLDGDVRFEATDVTVSHDDSRPAVTWSDAEGTHATSCTYLVGSDGDRGVSRDAIPDGVLTEYRYDFGYAWLAALVEAPVTGDAIMAVSDHGFVGQLPRGPQRSRYYLQCRLEDTEQDWPDERIWDEIRLRLNDQGIQDAAVVEKFFVPLRSVVRSPMRYRNLFLAGDAAHLVPPASAKGMNLALFDVGVLGEALVAALRDGDTAPLEAYSDTCLSHVWNYQDFATWMTDTMHDAGDPTQHGIFRQMTARARLDQLFSSPTAARLHREYQLGYN
ncbi:4-hydroxybenzoate 3-monooxygenase [Angustibacter aerolatus]